MLPEVEEERGNGCKKGKLRIGVGKGGKSVSAEISKPFSEGKMALCHLPTLPTNRLPPPIYMDPFIKWPGNVWKKPDPIFPDSGESQPCSAAKLSSNHPRSKSKEGVLRQRLCDKGMSLQLNPRVLPRKLHEGRATRANPEAPTMS